jgi:2'-5' RNA ligase
MPHITLVYPFRPREQFDAVSGGLRAACAHIGPFELQLRDFRTFAHGRGSHTLWLVPTPSGPLIDLQAALEAVVPDCSDTSAYAGGFTPHLSVGQARGKSAAGQLADALQAAWRPLQLRVNAVHLIWRGRPPNDVFCIDRGISLGGDVRQSAG